MIHFIGGFLTCLALLVTLCLWTLLKLTEGDTLQERWRNWMKTCKKMAEESAREKDEDE